MQATEALLLTEEEDTPTPSPTVTSAAVAPSPGGAIGAPVHPQAVTQRPTPATPVAPVNYPVTSPPQPTSVVGQAPVVQAAVTQTTPTLPPVNVEDLHKWLYKDPQGEIQGGRGMFGGVSCWGRVILGGGFVSCVYMCI